MTASTAPTHILESIYQHLSQWPELLTGRLVIAYSGGMDSTVLLHALAHLRDNPPKQSRLGGLSTPKHSFSLLAAYYHHAWRGTPAPELPRLQKNCHKLNVPFVIIPCDRQQPQTEAAARKVRYQQLTQLAFDLQAQAVLTAHQADDQAETILFRIFRGTGIDGLAGISPRLVLSASEGAAVPIVRPMLNVNREAIKAYINAHELYYFEDPSNQNTRFHRNAIRQEILPAIEKVFPNVQKALRQLAHLSQEDTDILNTSVGQVMEKLLPKTNPTEETSLGLDLTPFSQLGKAYQRRIIRQFLKKHNAEAGLHQVEATIHFIVQEHHHHKGNPLKAIGTTASGKARYLTIQRGRLRVLQPNEAIPFGPPDWSSPPETLLNTPAERPISDQVPASSAEHSGDVAVSSPRAEAATDEPEAPAGLHPGNMPPTPDILPTAENGYALRIALPGETYYPPARAILRAIPLTASQRKRVGLISAANSLEVYVNLEEVQDLPLTLRTRLPGDRIQPLGMPAIMRLKKYLINRQYPRFLRDKLPLLTCGQDVLWVPGVGISEWLRVEDTPTHLLRLVYSETDLPWIAPTPVPMEDMQAIYGLDLPEEPEARPTKLLIPGFGEDEEESEDSESASTASPDTAEAENAAEEVDEETAHHLPKRTAFTYGEDGLEDYTDETLDSPEEGPGNDPEADDLTADNSEASDGGHSSRAASAFELEDDETSEDETSRELYD
ncbi:MAG: tRNA lysidine(34) synthetase TilS [Candidatus Melainabacteria bacterium]|nr:tRNA lysidine(34) synthetase TilS [Candidatus Melainabacteria bacterium]